MSVKRLYECEMCHADFTEDSIAARSEMALIGLKKDPHPRKSEDWQLTSPLCADAHICRVCLPSLGVIANTITKCEPPPEFSQ